MRPLLANSIWHAIDTVDHVREHSRKAFSFFYKILYKFLQVWSGIELPCEVEIGENFIIHHFGAIVISGTRPRSGKT